jgi:hypothetical protein
MLTGNFTKELADQKANQFRTDAHAGGEVHRAVQNRRQRESLSKPVALFYRIATRSVSLSLLLVLGLSATAHAMPAAHEAVDKATKMGQPPAHLTKFVGTGTATDAWMGFAFILTLLVLLTATSARRRRATT